MKDTLRECIEEKRTSYTPIWFMRQAGRYLPEFQDIRKKNPDFIKLCLNERLSAEISLQPIKRFNLDAVIIFSDILMVPYGLGQKVEFKKGIGPILGELNFNVILNTKSKDFIEKLSPIYKAIKRVKENIKNKSLIGFVGAPWTLLVYMLNKESPKKNFDMSKIIKNKSLMRDLLLKLEDIIFLHAKEQIKAGANIIQIFDSWAGLLPKEKLSEYCYIPISKIVKNIKLLKIPVICFPKGIGENYIDFCNTVKPNCISIDYETDPEWIKKNLDGIPVQGGMDPKILLGEKEEIKKNVEKYLNTFKNYPYIFNLGHGVLPETKPEIIEFIIQTIKEKN
tara:strand:- start:1250 stop:2260 length:1011 start_codon:yes stop_codon:yes gene_type:complete